MLRVATFNLRNTTDRYPERLPLIVEAVTNMGADVVGLQEVWFDDCGRDSQSALVASACGYGYAFVNAATTEPYPRPPGDPTFCIDGNSIVYNTARLRLVSHQVLHISSIRCAQRALFVAADGTEDISGAAECGLPKGAFWVVNTHLHHTLDGEGVALRGAQAKAVCDWLDECGSTPVVMTGDFNAPPHEPGYEIIVSRGFTSAHHSVHGREPDHTFPTGLMAPTMDTDGPLTTDYIWMRAGPTALSCTIGANVPADHDSTLYPSDHMAVVADVLISSSGVTTCCVVGDTV